MPRLFVASLLGRSSVALAVATSLYVAAPASGQGMETSDGPDAVAVTIYRNPNRSADQQMDPDWLDGFALVSETRRVSIPAGESIVRFEGVAGGIIPESAIVTGFPEGVVERNQDAWLLSPASLLDRSLARRVHLRRTSADGQVREHEAVIRSGAGGAVVLQTDEGFEALRCSGIPETIVYPEVPQGLSARPTLSVRVRSDRPVSANVTLSYLATGFDWQANYVAHLSPSGDRVDLFAWVTLASSDETSFVDAETQAVAGRLNREDDLPESPAEPAALNLRCWPQGSTSDLPLEQQEERGAVARAFAVPTPAPPPPPAIAQEDIVVTGSRMARQEELGDLKLYRFPDPVTVAANSQKQVAFLDRDEVRARIVYRNRLDPAALEEPLPAERLLVTRNRTGEGLGIPLPAGRLILFGEGRERPILLGQGSLRDHAVGEDVEIEFGRATGVRAEINLISKQGSSIEYELVVTNDQSHPVPYEVEFMGAQQPTGRLRLPRRDGRPFWAVTIPANGRATLRYRLRPEA